MFIPPSDDLVILARHPGWNPVWKAFALLLLAFSPAVVEHHNFRSYQPRRCHHLPAALGLSRARVMAVEYTAKSELEALAPEGSVGTASRSPSEDAWFEGYNRLVEYQSEHGNCNIPPDFIAADGYKLGQWVVEQRQQRKDSGLTESRSMHLEALGMIWDVHESAWMEGYNQLVKYQSEHGDCHVKRGVITADGYNLGIWVMHQRQKYKKSSLSESQVMRLEELGFIWDPAENAWLAGYNHLVKYQAKHGDCDVPPIFITEDDYNLGYWVMTQRRKNKGQRGGLTESQLRRLQELGLKLDPFEDAWQEGYRHLVDYQTEHGDCNVPHKFVTEGGYKLGQWVLTQRQRYKSERDKLHLSRKVQLEELGMRWDTFEEAFLIGCKELVEYLSKHGHCNVPPNFITANGYNLGRWVSKLRKRGKVDLTDSQAFRLDAMGFDWDPANAAWVEGYQRLVEYQSEHGDCNVLYTFITADGYKLGRWVESQRNEHRKKHSGLTDSQIMDLEALGMTWDVLPVAWQEAYNQLVEYHSEHGDCNVHYNFVTADGFKLGRWVYAQRRRHKAKRLSETQKVRMEKLGFEWDPQRVTWLQGYSQLVKYHSEHGDCSVPHKFVTADGYNLGSWIAVQRKNHRGNLRVGPLTESQRKQLEELGLEWDPSENAWLEGYNHLVAYRKQHGDCKVPPSFRTTNGYCLGNWLSRQRQILRDDKETLSTSRKMRRSMLLALGLEASAAAEKVKKGYDHLEAYKKEHGNCNVPRLFVTADGFKLGIWLRQQKFKRNDPRLLMLGLEDYDINCEWHDSYDRLQRYKEKHGHCRVPQSFEMRDGFKLGSWVMRQRQECKKGALSDERIGLLDAVGFEFDRWDSAFRQLEAYKMEHGDSKVPYRFVTENGFKLGVWLSGQRKYLKATPRQNKTRVSLLRDMDVQAYPFDAAWEKGYKHLKAYRETIGDGPVPSNFTTADGYRLGAWVQAQLHRPSFSSKRLKLKGAHEVRWQKGYNRLKAYKRKHGDCSVLPNYVDPEGFKLWHWVRWQRMSVVFHMYI